MKIYLFAISIALIQSISYSQSLTPQQKLGYSSGFVNGQKTFNNDILSNKEVNLNEISNGFKEGFKDAPFTNECVDKLTNPYLITEDSVAYIDTIQFSYCTGQQKGSEFYRAIKEFMILDRMDLEYVKLGMEDFLLQEEPMVPLSEMNILVENIRTELASTYGLESKHRNARIKGEALSWKKKVVYENGIIISTVKRGWWWKHPVKESSITANYVATNNFSKIIDENFKTKPLDAELSNLIDGWQFAVSKMRKKGKYKVYIPADLAYGDGDLIYEITLLSFKNPSK